MIIELHVLQNFASSCLNRDDLNTPKEAYFGGCVRKRVSSQSWKRAVRFHKIFLEHLKAGNDSQYIGIRTKLLLSHLVDKIVKNGHDRDEAMRVVEPVVASIGSGVEGEGRTPVALYLGHDEIQRIADAIEQHYDDLLQASNEEPPQTDDQAAKSKSKGKKSTTKKGSGTPTAKVIADNITRSVRSGTQAADIALYGRMIAQAHHFSVDAAAQVAHAISTHKGMPEYDYWTAVDDLQPKENPGAGMIGTQQFSSATFYRYTNIDLDQLLYNLCGDANLARIAAMAFIHAFVLAIPPAKQNSHAAHNVPDLVFMVLRSSGQPMSLANAFTRPVDANGPLGLMGNSATAMADYWRRLNQAYGKRGIVTAAYYSVADDCDGVTITDATRIEGIDALIDLLTTNLSTWPKEVRP